MEFTQALNAYVAMLQEVENKKTNPARIGISPRGKRFLRIYREYGFGQGCEILRAALKGMSASVGSGQSVVIFVERETGFLWAPNGWKAPVLNFPRGNVYELAK